MSKNLSESTNTITVELNHTLQGIISLISKCFTPDIISIVFSRNNHLLPVSNFESINHTEIEVNHSENQQEKYQRSVIKHEQILSFQTETLIAKTGKEIGFISIGYKTLKIFSTEEQLLLENIANIARETIEKHLEAQKMVDVFTNIVHKIIHDLKNPFTSIALTTEVLKKKAEEARAVEILTTKLQATNNRVFNHLEKLLQTFPAKRETFKLQIAKIKVNTLLNEIRIENFKNLPELKEKLDFITDREVLKEAIILIITHFSILNADITEMNANSTENFSSLVVITKQATKEINRPNINFAETNALLIAIKLIELLDGKVKHGCNQNDNTYRVQITLSV